MKKFLIVFIGSMIVIPGFADIVQYDSPTTATNQASAVVSSNAPKYAFDEITSSDQGHIASTAYVKGAYNSALSAINYLSDSKQEQLKNDAANNIANISATVKTTMTTALTGASQASDTSLVTERAIATVLADKVDTLTNDANNGTHPLVTALTKSGGTITVTKGEVTIPVGSVASPTSHAEIWIE